MTAHRFTYPPLAVQVAEPTPSVSTMAGRTGGAHPPTAAFDNACAAIQAQAARTACVMIKARARDYLAEPWQLDMLRKGFVASGFFPDQLIEFAIELLRVTAIFHRCETVPIQKINARAAIVAGRYRRAKACQLSRMAVV